MARRSAGPGARTPTGTPPGVRPAGPCRSGPAPARPRWRPSAGTATTTDPPSSTAPAQVSGGGRVRPMGRGPVPTAAVIECRTLRAADTVPTDSSEYDGGKEMTGRTQHGAVDTGGRLLAVVVTTASLQD